MFELLLLKISQVQNKLTSIEVEVNELQNENEKVTKSQKRTQSRARMVATDLNDMGEMVTDLMQVISKNEQDISLLQNKVESLQIRSLKGQWVIRGVKVVQNENPIQTVKDFL